MTTAWPGVVASARPSPWPTSQATSRQPGGGHPTLPVGQAAASETAASAATSPGRRRSRATSHGPQNSSTRLSPASRNAPGGPSGQGSEPIGTSAQDRATQAIPVVGSIATQATAAATGAATTASSATVTPSTVAGATSGAASRLASTPTTLTEPCSSTTTGPHIACAATGIAIAAPSQCRRSGR